MHGTLIHRNILLFHHCMWFKISSLSWQKRNLRSENDWSYILLQTSMEFFSLLHPVPLYRDVICRVKYSITYRCVIRRERLTILHALIYRFSSTSIQHLGGWSRVHPLSIKQRRTLFEFWDRKCKKMYNMIYLITWKVI